MRMGAPLKHGRQSRPMPIDANASLARRLGPFVYPYRWGAVLTVLAYLCLAGTEWLLPKLISYAFDDEGFTKDAYPLWMVPVVLIGLYAVRGASSFAGQYLFHWTQTRSVLDFAPRWSARCYGWTPRPTRACSPAPRSPRSSTTRSRSCS